ncbi:MAG: OmpA family protein [Thermotogales bacterium]|nr:OmpA family protein [Thermotogales bacterium]
MEQLKRTIVLIGLGLTSGMVSAAPGYVDQSGESIVRAGSGDCLHTGRWSEQNAIAECDPEIVAARDRPVEVAAVEMVIRKELKPIQLEADALFEFDGATLTDEGRAQLDTVMSQLPDRSVLKDKRITITGFTDRLGPDSYNQMLSEKRAQAVHDYLVSKGMRDEAIDARGLGSANPLVVCEGMRGNSLINCLAPNRRTEIEFSAMEVVEVEEEVEVTP